MSIGRNIKCVYHPDRESTRICAVCNKSVCTECSDYVADRVLCKKCQKAVISLIREKGKQQSSDSTDYIMPVGSIGLALLFFIIYISSSAKTFLYISGILFAIGIALLIPTIIHQKRIHADRKAPILTTKQKIGRGLFIISALYLLIGPITIGMFYDLNGLFIILSILISIIVIVIGLRLAKA